MDFVALLERAGVPLMEACSCGKALKKVSEPCCRACADRRLQRLFAEDHDDAKT